MIPSFRMEFAEADFLGEMGWIANCRPNVPDVIPVGYLEGKEMERDGKTFRSVDAMYLRRKYGREPLPAGRLVAFSYMSYGSNPHVYGNISISGVEMVYEDPENDQVISTGGQDYSFDIELCRILPQEEIDAWPRMWETYYAGCRTQRFSNFVELLATAAYVALTKIEGPFTMIRDNTFSYEEKNRLMSVSETGEVQFSPLMENWLSVE